MKWDTAIDIWQRIGNSGCEMNHDLAEMMKEMVNCALKYARIRTDWQLADFDRRREMDFSRTCAHNDFINSCRIFGRNLGKSGFDDTWLVTLGEDRKDIGDFACFIHCLLGLQAR